MNEEAPHHLLACRNLDKVYLSGEQRLQVLHQLDLTVHPHEFLAITGESGCGKSTLLQLLGALDVPTAGEILYQGQRLDAYTETQRNQLRNREFGFVFQFHYLLAEFSAIENVAIPGMIAGIPERDLWPRAGQLLEELNLGERAHHRPSKLSGGEQQRVAVARALMNEPRVLFMDEPTGNLDPNTSEELIALIQRQRQHHAMAIVMVTHNQDIAAAADRHLILRDQRVLPA